MEKNLKFRKLTRHEQLKIVAGTQQIANNNCACSCGCSCCNTTGNGNGGGGTNNGSTTGNI